MDKKLTIKESFNLGKGWNLMIFAILAMLVTNAGVNDGLNIALPEIAKGAGLDYELCLSMGTVAGFVGVAMMLVIAKFRDRFGGRKVSAALFIIFGFTFYFLFLRASNIVMYAISQCIMVSCGQGCFYLCTGPMQSDWFPKKRGVVNGISTIGANIGTAILAPIMTTLLTMAEYKTSLSVFAVAAVVLGIFAYLTLRDDPLEAGMYPDNVTKEVYEKEYKNISKKDEYVSDWTIPKMLKCKEVWLAAMVPGFITLGSSEVPMHTAVLRARPDVKATVHTHAMNATIMAMGDDAELKPITPPQCEFVPVGIVPFTMPGSDEVADKVVEALGKDGRSVLIKNHGMFCCGKNMKAAMAATEYTEEMAVTTLYAKLLGTYEPMPEEGVKKMKELIAADQAV